MSTTPDRKDPPRPTNVSTVHDFGTALRALRTWAGLTLLELAKAGELRKTTVSDDECGVRLPPLERVHTFVTTCLHHRNPNAPQAWATAEMTVWRDTWTRLHRATATASPVATPTGPARPIEEPVPPPRTPEPPALPPPTAAAPRRPSRRGPVLVGGAVAAVVIAAVVIAAHAGMFSTAPVTAGTATSSSQPASLSGAAVAAGSVHNSGQVDNLRGVEGIDLDTNTRTDQDAPGVDISPAAAATHLNLMDPRVYATVLPDTGPEARDRCVVAVDWMRQIPGIYDLTEGRNICIKTDEGRFSMLTITKRSSAAAPVMNFHYTTWN